MQTQRNQTDVSRPNEVSRASGFALTRKDLVKHRIYGNYSALLILRCHALDSCTQSACQRFGILVPGVTPCGLTPGCDMVPLYGLHVDKVFRV